jgi:hypothetical protein
MLWVFALHLTLKRLIEKSKNSLKKVEDLTEDNVVHEGVHSVKTIDKEKIFPDMTNFYLKGFLGQLWLILSIGNFINSRESKFKKINYIWYIPSLFLILSILISPMTICLYFIIQLFLTGTLWLGLVYSILFVPCSILFLSLIAILFVLALFGKLANVRGHSGRRMRVRD